MGHVFGLPHTPSVGGNPSMKDVFVLDLQITSAEHLDDRRPVKARCRKLVLISGVEARAKLGARSGEFERRICDMYHITYTPCRRGIQRVAHVASSGNLDCAQHLACHACCIWDRLASLVGKRLGSSAWSFVGAAPLIQAQCIYVYVCIHVCMYHLGDSSGINACELCR